MSTAPVTVRSIPVVGVFDTARAEVLVNGVKVGEVYETTTQVVSMRTGRMTTRRNWHVQNRDTFGLRLTRKAAADIVARAAASSVR